MQNKFEQSSLSLRKCSESQTVLNEIHVNAVLKSKNMKILKSARDKEIILKNHINCRFYNRKKEEEARYA